MVFIFLWLENVLMENRINKFLLTGCFDNRQSGLFEHPALSNLQVDGTQLWQAGQLYYLPQLFLRSIQYLNWQQLDSTGPAHAASSYTARSHCCQIAETSMVMGSWPVVHSYQIACQPTVQPLAPSGIPQRGCLMQLLQQVQRFVCNFYVRNTLFPLHSIFRHTLQQLRSLGLAGSHSDSQSKRSSDGCCQRLLLDL